MCGVAGILTTADEWSIGQRLGQPLPAALEAMTTVMAHRGPDDSGIEPIDGAASGGLGACRLAIQDTSLRGHMPMTGAESGVVTTFNGEIYNFRELRRELEGRGASFQSGCDTEVILRGYEAWGLDCFERFRGMFAVAIWDRARGTLVLARDRLGIKPLYIHASDGLIGYASELRALLAAGVVEPKVSPAGLESFLTLGAVVEPHTLVADVQMLPPATIGVWKDGSLATHSYWSLADAFDRASAVSRSELLDRTRAVLEESMRQHLISDRPTGVFLSGGIDSTVLTALASTVGSEAPTTASVVFPYPEFSEEPFIDEVRARYETNHLRVELSEREVLDTLGAGVDAMDQPTFDGLNTYIVSGAAKGAGLTVALSGVGGDELFGGYASFRHVPRMERVRALTRRTGMRSPLRAVAHALPASDRAEKVRRLLTASDRDLPDTYVLRRELFGADTRRALLGSNDAPAPWLRANGHTDLTNAVSEAELAVYMRNVLLRDTDVMSMAHALEVRVPFLDHELVELVAPAPGSWKMEGRENKSVLVDACRDLIPPNLTARRKMGFTLPYEVWLRGPLRAQVEECLRDPGYGGQVAALLDARATEHIWDRFVDGKAIWTRPWALYVAKRWGAALEQAARPPALRT